MNLQENTQWNKDDDEYFIIQKKWFEIKWKDFIKFEPFYKYFSEQLAVSDQIDLSGFDVKKISNPGSFPGEINNNYLL